MIHTALNHRLAPGALYHDVLVFAVQHVTTVAAKGKCHSFIHDPPNIFSQETSFTYHREDNTFFLLLDIPLIENHNLLPIHKFIPLEVHFDFSDKISIAPNIGPKKLIAVGHTKGIQTPSLANLSNCFCLGKNFFCAGRIVLHTNIVKDCMGSLFLASSSLIENNCKFQIKDTRESIISHTNNTWLVYSVRKIASNHVCPKVDQLSPLNISLGQIIQVQPGCHIWTMDQVITADNSEDHSIQPGWTGQCHFCGSLIIQMMITS